MTIHAIHESSWKGVFYVTGGGSGFLSNLLAQAGASATVLDAQIPYSSAALHELLGEHIDSHCSKETACGLAMCAFQRARALTEDDNLFGFACTASLRSKEPKKGEHRAHIAFQSADRTSHWHVSFEKDALSREEEENELADALEASLASQLGITAPNTLPSVETAVANDELRSLMLGERLQLHGSASAFLPGAFNPLHQGHEKMRDLSEDLLGESVQYELSIRNVDKPPMDFLQLKERTNQFDDGSYVLTNAPTFVEKVRALSGSRSCRFIVGVDTIERIASPIYYQNSVVHRDAAIQVFEDQDVSFLVFGRIEANEFKTLDDLDLPDRLKARCTGVAEADFRMDMSSTAIRKSKAR